MLETIVYDILSTAIEEEFSDASIVNQYEPEVTTFPHIMIEQTNSFNDIDSMTKQANFDNVIFQIEIYTIGDYKKKDAKEIADIVQDEMSILGFLKEQRSPVDNLQNRDVYRLMLRFSGKKDLTKNSLYRR
ncbi:MAG: hypothetical protein ACOCQD_01525 [archaeon]